MRKQTTLVRADEWLDGLMHRSPAFQARVEQELAAINVAQDLVALRESRGLESAQPKNLELRTLVRAATALGAHLDVSVRPRRQNERKSRQRAGQARENTGRPLLTIVRATMAIQSRPSKVHSCVGAESEPRR
jgi:hypothetical protein